MSILIYSLRRVAKGALIVALGGAVATAQSAPQLPSQLSPETRAAILRILDSARVAGVPTAPLTDKVAEGVLKGADDRRILAAVQAFAHQLELAHAILGNGTVSYSLLGATASALQAGVSVTDLRRLVMASPTWTSDSRALVGGLVTLVDLIAKQIPPNMAAISIEDLLRRRATEDQFVQLRAEVARDILAGQPPEAALETRMRAYAKVLDASPASAPRRPPATGARPPIVDPPM